MDQDYQAQLTPDSVYDILKKGNQRFMSGEKGEDNIEIDRRQASEVIGQQPIATVLTCSDSRIPVEVIFNKRVGDLFVVQVAGNVCGPLTAGSLEYAVEFLETPVVVILGHEHCGAISAVADAYKLQSAMGAVADKIRPAIAVFKKKNQEMGKRELISAAVRENVKNSYEELIKRSSFISAGMKEGKVMVVGAVYNSDTGEVTWLDQFK